MRHEWPVAVKEGVPLADSEGGVLGVEAHQASVGRVKHDLGVAIPDVPEIMLSHCSVSSIKN